MRAAAAKRPVGWFWAGFAGGAVYFYPGAVVCGSALLIEPAVGSVEPGPGLRNEDHAAGFEEAYRRELRRRRFNRAAGGTLSGFGVGLVLIFLLDP